MFSTTTMQQSYIAIIPWLSSLLRRCAASSTLRPGQQAHAQALSRGLLPHATLETDLLLLYSRCLELPIARQVFDQMPHKSMHSWNILLSSYVQASLLDHAFSLLRPFLASGLRPDHFTLPSLLKASAAAAALPLGMAFHNWVISLGHNENIIVRSSILDMYAKCGSLNDAMYLFDAMPNRDAVTWNSMITGLAKAGLTVEALNLFRRSLLEVEEMDFGAIPSILNACGKEGDLRRGKEVHGRAIRCLMYDSDAAIGNSLIDMYGRCGRLDNSYNVFTNMCRRNLVTWSTMISCFGVHGKGNDSLKLYEEMIAQGMKPNCITFTSVLSSCSHSGLLGEGRRIFDSMTREHYVLPSIKHYACMVDLMGRAASIGEALGFIHAMPMDPSASVWGALLGACVVHKNVEVGEIASYILFDLEPGNPSNYVSLCSIYEAVGRFDNLARIRSRMRKLGMIKTPGCSWIDIDRRLHAFYQNDARRPFTGEIHDVLDMLAKVMAAPEDFIGA